MKRLLAGLAAVLCLSSLAACAKTPPPAEPLTPPAETPAPPPPEPTAEELAARVIDDTLAGMTTEEKVGQLFFVRCPDTGAVEDIAAYHLGGYVLFGRDFGDRTADQVIQTHRRYQAVALADSGIPLLLGVDEEGGTVVRVSADPHLRETKYPAPRKLLAAGGIDALTADAAEKDALLHGLGLNVNLAPVADLSTDPDNFIYARAMGLDAQGTAGCVSALVEQMARDNMGSVLKHFPGYGGNADTHTGIARDPRPYETFATADFLPFRAGIDAGGGKTAVLVSHNIVETMDPELPASLSPEIHRILREELAFDGVAMTDDLAMDAVAAYAEDGAVAVMALKAGNDLVITTDYRTQIPKVLAAMESGGLSMDAIDAACRRVLTWKQALGLLPMQPAG